MKKKHEKKKAGPPNMRREYRDEIGVHKRRLRDLDRASKVVIARFNREAKRLAAECLNEVRGHKTESARLVQRVAILQGRIAA